MLPVSEDYIAAMYTSLRTAPCHCSVFFGIYDETAYDDAMYAIPAGLSYSTTDAKMPTESKQAAEYANYETDSYRMDESQLLHPSSTAEYKTQGWVSAEISGAGGVFAHPPTFDITFTETHNMPGITVTFGKLENDVPGQVTLSCYSSGVLVREMSYTELDVTTQLELGIEDADEIVLRFDRAQEAGQRARLTALSFGVGYSFEDEQIVDLTERHTISPCSLELPTSALNVSLDDTDGRFDPDADTALTKSLRFSQSATVRYGVEVNGGTEWVPGGTWYLESWSCEDRKASFVFHDLLQEINSVPFETDTRGPIKTNSTYAEMLCDLAGKATGLRIKSDWRSYNFNTVATPAALDSTLATALQENANACKSLLFVDKRLNTVVTKYVSNSTKSDVRVSLSSSVSEYTDAGSILKGGQEYADYSADSYRLDGTQKMIPDNASGPIPGACLVSTVVDKSDHYLTLPPGVYFAFNTPVQLSQIRLFFGQNYPGVDPEWKRALRIGMSAYDSTAEDPSWSSTEYVYLSKEPAGYDENSYISVEPKSEVFRKATQIVVYIYAWSKIGQRAKILRVQPIYDSSIAVKREYLFSPVKKDLLPQLRNCTIWSFPVIWRYKSTEEKGAESWTVDTQQDNLRLEHGCVEVTEPSSVFSNTEFQVIDDTGTAETDPVTIEETHYSWVSYVSLHSRERKSVKLILRAWYMENTEKSTTLRVNKSGEDLEVRNRIRYFTGPNIYDTDAQWHADYFRSRLQYTYDSLGFPELECGDFIEDHNGKQSRVISTELTYNGGFRGKYIVREVESE